MLLHHPQAPQDPALSDPRQGPQQLFGGLLEIIYDHLQTRPSFFAPLLRYGPDGWHIAKEGGE